MKHHLRRVRPRNQVGRPQHIEKTLRTDPGSALNHLVFKHGDMRRGTAKTKEAQLETEQRQFSKA